jgi:hypothetical protein
MNITWEDMLKDKTGKIYLDWIDEDIRCLIMKGPASLCTYIGLPKDHILSGFNYNDLPLNVHGGLTFSSIGDGKVWPKNYWWYGFDYAHSGDYSFYYDTCKDILETYSYHNSEHQWIVSEVEIEAKQTIIELKEYIKKINSLICNKSMALLNIRNDDSIIQKLAERKLKEDI